MYKPYNQINWKNIIVYFVPNYHIIKEEINFWLNAKSPHVIVAQYDHCCIYGGRGWELGHKPRETFSRQSWIWPYNDMNANLMGFCISNYYDLHIT